MDQDFLDIHCMSYSANSYYGDLGLVNQSIKKGEISYVYLSQAFDKIESSNKSGFFYSQKRPFFIHACAKHVLSYHLILVPWVLSILRIERSWRLIKGSYCMPKKSWHILYSNSPYKMDQDFLDIHCQQLLWRPRPSKAKDKNIKGRSQAACGCWSCSCCCGGCVSTVKVPRLSSSLKCRRFCLSTRM